jgi:hypothetical protein
MDRISIRLALTLFAATAVLIGTGSLLRQEFMRAVDQNHPYPASGPLPEPTDTVTEFNMKETQVFPDQNSAKLPLTHSANWQAPKNCQTVRAWVKYDPSDSSEVVLFLAQASQVEKSYFLTASRDSVFWGPCERCKAKGRSIKFTSGLLNLGGWKMITATIRSSVLATEWFLYMDDTLVSYIKDRPRIKPASITQLNIREKNTKFEVKNLSGYEKCLSLEEVESIFWKERLREANNEAI